jgi:hypothetical protein
MGHQLTYLARSHTLRQPPAQLSGFGFLLSYDKGGPGELQVPSGLQMLLLMLFQLLQEAAKSALAKSW